MKKNSNGRSLFFLFIFTNVWLSINASAVLHRSVSTSPIDFPAPDNQKAPPKNFGAPLKVMVNEDFEIKVFCLFPTDNEEKTVPISEISRSLRAHDEAQRVLNKNMKKVPFIFWIDCYDVPEYYSFNPKTAIKEILATQGKLKTPPSAKEIIENENAEIIEKTKFEEEEKAKKADEDDADIYDE